MRLLHTADWHLGQRFHGFDRLHEQAHFLDWLAEQIVAHDVDALLVAGDIFDTLSPSASALRLLYGFLARIASLREGVQVVMIAGNHDSGLRLEAAQPLLSALNVHVRGVVPRLPDGAIDYDYFAIPLRCRSGEEGVCMAVPYLRPADCPVVGDDEDPYLAFFRELRAHIPEHEGPCVAMAHLFASNAVSSSGRAIMMGGLEKVGAAAFPPDAYDYVALGHIHCPQRVYGRETVRYSGSPISMSFAEKEYQHQVLMLDIDADGTRVEPLIYDVPVQLFEIAGTPKAIREQIRQLPEGEPDEWAPILSLAVEVDGPMPSLRRDVQEWAEGHRVRLGPMRVLMPTDSGANEELAMLAHGRIDPESVAQGAYQLQFGVNMPGPLLERFRWVVEQCQTENQHAHTGN